MAYETLRNEPIYCQLLETYMNTVNPRFEDSIFNGDTLNVQDNENIYICPNEGVIELTTKEESRVLCNYCIQSPLPAWKYCQTCEVHLCRLHLAVHSKSAEHVITESIRSPVKMEKSKCPKLTEILKFYSPDYDNYLGGLWYMNGSHKGHKTELLEEASQRKKKDALKNITAKQKEIDEKVQFLKKKTINVDVKAAKTAERVTALFRNIRRQLDDLEIRVLSEISKEQEQVSRPFSLLIKQLEQKQVDLSEKRKDIEKLCDLVSPFNVLTTGQNTVDFDDQEYMVYDTKDFDEGLISATLQKSIEKIMAGIKWEQGVSDMFLNVNTAANDVYISGDKKTVSWTTIKQDRQKTGKRFKCHQVLGTKSFSSGRHFWEVETSESGKWIIGMCYSSIDKKGDESFIGKNNKSWGLGKLEKYKVVHDLKEKQIPSLAIIQRLGIYLDYEAGQLSFYELCDPIRHLHTFNAKFTEPLYPVIWVWHSWVRLKS